MVIETARLGRSGLQVSRLAIGTMTFGAQMDELMAHRLLDEAFEAGVNFFDCAEIYPAPSTAASYGAAEAILGRWLKRTSRDRVIISTKVMGASDRPEGPRLPWVRGGLTSIDRFHVIAACEASLRRLGTDYIDLYQPHWPDRKTTIEEQLEAFALLIRQGKVRYFGLSNETAWGLTAFCAAGRPRGTEPIAVQNAYNLLQRRFELGLAEACEQEQVSFIAYSPLAMGVLTGKYAQGRRPEHARLSADDRYGRMYLQDRLLAAADAYVEVAARYELDPTALAYAWVRQQPHVSVVLSSFSDIAQLKPFLESTEITLAATTQSELDDVRQLHDARWNLLG